MKKTAIIGSVGIPANYGGFETLTEQLAIQLQERFEITVYCSKSAFKTHPGKIQNIRLKYLPLKANGIQSILYDMLSIFNAITYADSLLILGVSGCTLLPFLRLFGCRKKIVVNIDGIEWKRAKWSGFARWFLRFSEKCAVKYSDVVIGDNQVITDYVKATYGKHCELIEYGADNKKLEAK